MPRRERGSKPKTAWRDVRGILLLDKPRGLSSNAALQEVRQLFAAAKGGHTGSLDPLATGLLPICFGEATKIAGLLLGSRKAYATEALLGITTDTDDADGSVVLQREVPDLDDAEIRAALGGLVGCIRQVPPVYSALKQGGERLYARARRGEAVEVPEREVEVQRFELLGREGPSLHLLVECGSGTYVRSLVRDLGERLRCGAHVVALRRLWIEPFLEPVMYTLEQLAERAAQGQAALDALLLPLEQGLAGYPRARLDAAQALKLRQGQAIEWVGQAGSCVALDEDGHAVALAEVAGGRLRTLRTFNPVPGP